MYIKTNLLLKLYRFKYSENTELKQKKMFFSSLNIARREYIILKCRYNSYFDIAFHCLG